MSTRSVGKAAGVLFGVAAGAAFAAKPDPLALTRADLAFDRLEFAKAP